MKVRGDFLGPPRSTDKTTLIIKVSKPTETFFYINLIGTYRIFNQRRLSQVYAYAQPSLRFRCLHYSRKKFVELGICRNLKQQRLSRVYAKAQSHL